jgi:hypothetical protein
MAKASNLNARLISLKEETDQLKANELQLQKLYALEDKITDAQFQKVEALEAQNKVLQKSKSQYEQLLKLQKQKAKLLQAELKDYDDIDTNLVSIGNTIGKNTKAYQFQKEKLDQTKGVIESIGVVITKNSKINDKDKDQMAKVLKAYKQNQASILEASKLKARDKISQQEYLKLVEDSRKTYSDLRSEIELSAEATALLGDHIAKMDNEINTFANTAKKSATALKGVESAIDHIGGSGVEGVRELGDVLKSAANGGKGLTTALSVAAGALAAMAYNYGLIGDKVGTIAKYDKDIIGVQGSIDATNKQISMGVDLPTYDKAGKNITGTFKAVNYVAKQAMLDFSTSVQQMGASFQAASKTALFGNKLGGVGYAASSLQMAGISAENIAESMQAASDATGKMPTGKMAADMSIMAQRTGQSTESIATINETFQRLDKVSEKTALNLQEGVRAMADKAGVNLGSAMAEIAEASKDALSYQIKGSSQLAKQVIYAKSLGVSFNEVAKAGQNMVLNYKDSIKSEMSLSAMLGKNVNLSEVRAKFMSGDQEGAMKSLKAQGLNPKDMNMFQQQALSEALGGMDLNSIQKITENTGKSGGDLKEGKAGGSNAQYLAAKTAAEASLAATNAMISAQAELQSIKLSTAEQQQLQEALGKNVNKLATETNNKAQLEALKNAETGLTAAIIGLTVAIGVQMLPGLLKFGKGLISPGAKVAEKVVAKTAGKTVAKTAATTTGKTVATTAGKTAATTAGKTVAGVAGKAGAQVAEKVGAKGIAKVGAKALGKSLLKKIPVIGLLAGVGFGLSRLAKGDYAGAAMELASGAAGTIPGIGTAASIGIDTALAAKDMGAFDKAPTAAAAGAKPAVVSKEQQAKPIETGTKPTVEAVNTMGQKQIDAQKMAADKAKVTLTETQYGAKLQQEIVALLGINAQFLGQISENTAKDASININGKALQSSLLNQARRLYGVARTA